MLVAEVKDLTREIKLVIGESGARFPHANSLFIDDDVKGMLDSGLGEDLNLLYRDKVELLAHSHFHIDHIKGNYQFQRAKFYAHELDAPVIRSEDKFMSLTGFDTIPGGRTEIKGYGYKPSRIDGTFVDGEIIDFGKTKCQVVHLPGHSAGHCGFFFSDDELMFTGDIELTKFGPWYGFADCDIDQFIASIHKIGDFHPRQIATSHTELITENLPEKLRLYIEVIDQRDKLLLNYLIKPHTLDELVHQKFMYRKHPEPTNFFFHWEMGLVKTHLARLLHQGQIVFEAGQYRKI
ncbi:MAG: MBL fold metallo-hydrolase [Carboxydocellales bacterium]